jgi:hypothetical protein
MTVITRDWYLEINGVPLATPAWEIPDLSILLDSPSLRGSDVLLPLAGFRGYRRRPSLTVLTFALDVQGDVDEDGAPTADGLTGVVEHMEYLTTALGYAEATGDGTVPAIFHRGSLPALGADVHFLGFKGSQKQGTFLVRTTFDISIPAGQWEEVGS